MLTKALVARVVDYGESDRVCTLLTQGFGKISVLAKSARKSRRRFGGALSLFVLGEATLGQHSRGDLFTLERFDSVEDLGPSILSDLVKVAHGSYMVELVRELWPAGQQEPRLFHFLWQALKALANFPSSKTLLRAFELQVLALAGLVPNFEHCVCCGEKPVEGALGFNVDQGGVVCSHCGPHILPLSKDALQQLRKLQGISLEDAAQTNLEPDIASRLRDLMLMVVRHHLGKDLRSLEFIAQLPRTPPKSSR